MSQKLINFNYRILKDNQQCLKVIKILNQNLNYKKYEDQENLIKIFYQEISAYVTNLILIKNSQFKNSDKINFPYINSSYIKKPSRVKFKNSKKERKLFEKISLGSSKKKFSFQKIFI